MESIASLGLQALILGALLWIAVALRPRNTPRSLRYLRGGEVLPLCSGVPVPPGKSASIIGRPGCHFRGDRVFISAAGTDGGSADWIVNDIKVDGRSQLSQSGDVPGDMFASNAIDAFVAFQPCPAQAPFTIVVTYIGTKPEGVPFYGSICGVKVSDRELRTAERKYAGEVRSLIKHWERLEKRAAARKAAEHARTEIAKAAGG